MTDGFHHFQKRRRLGIKHEAYPHPDKLKRFVDGLLYFGGVMGPIMTIPQLIEIWLKKEASGVSAISWGAYLLGALFWLFYGLIHKEKPIIFAYGMWVVLDLLIVVGVLIYG